MKKRPARGTCPPTVDREQEPHGFWAVHEARDGFPPEYGKFFASRAHDEYGQAMDTPETLKGFETREAACLATWEGIPDCDGSGDSCPAPGHGGLLVVM